MQSVLSILVPLLFSAVFTVLYLVWTHARKQSLELIQSELNAGKTMLFKASVGGYVSGMHYKGPLLTLAVFDDCFILKDQKVLFSDIKAVSKSTLAGIKVATHSGQEIRIYHNGSFLKFFPEAVRPEKS